MKNYKSTYPQLWQTRSDCKLPVNILSIIQLHFLLLLLLLLLLLCDELLLLLVVDEQSFDSMNCFDFNFNSNGKKKDIPDE